MKAGFVGLVGLTNAGKSTLVNALLGEKVGIVTRKPQTTRRRVLGIYNDEDSQIVLVDAPGQVKDTRGLNGFLESEFRSVIEESEVLMAVLNLDAKNPKDLEGVLDLVVRSGKPWLAVITKDDLPLPHRNVHLRQLVQSYMSAQGESELGGGSGGVIAVSALKRSDALKEILLPILKAKLPNAEAPLYPTDYYTTESERDLISEIVREKCFQRLHDEIPYGLATKCIDFSESDDQIQCLVDIVVAKKGHIPMVVGKSGKNLKLIGMNARKEVEAKLGKKVFLKTYVKCIEDWVNRSQRRGELGYAERS